MPPKSFSLATILAIAIPLGVIALIGILVLSFIVIRLSIVASREKKAYQMARNGDFRRTSAIGSEAAAASRSSNSHRRSRLGFCDFFCCVPIPSDWVPYRHSSSRDENNTEVPPNSFNHPQQRQEKEVASLRSTGRTSGKIGEALSGETSPHQEQTRPVYPGPPTDTKPPVLPLLPSTLVKSTGDRHRSDNEWLRLTAAALDVSSTDNISPPPPARTTFVSYAAEKKLEDESGLDTTPSIMSSGRNSFMGNDIKPRVGGEHSAVDGGQYRRGAVEAIDGADGSVLLSSMKSFHSDRRSPLGSQYSMPRMTELPSKEDQWRVGSRTEDKPQSSVPPLSAGNISTSLPSLPSLPQIGSDPLSWEDAQGLLLAPNVLDLIPPPRSALRGKSASQSPQSSIFRGSPPALGKPGEIDLGKMTPESLKTIYRTPPIVPSTDSGPKAEIESILLDPNSRNAESKAESVNSSLDAGSDVLNQDTSPLKVHTRRGVSGAISRAVTKPPKDSDLRVKAAVDAGVFDPRKHPGFSAGAHSGHAEPIDHERIANMLNSNDSLHKGDAHACRTEIERGYLELPSVYGSLIRDSSTTTAAGDLEAPMLSDMDSQKVEVGSSNKGKPGLFQRTSRVFAPLSLDGLGDATKDMLRRSRRSSSKTSESGDRLATTWDSIDLQSPLLPSTNSMKPTSRSSSLTASSEGEPYTRSPISERTSSPTKPAEQWTGLRPMSTKTASTIRNIAALSAPRMPRSPGYAPTYSGSNVRTRPRESPRRTSQLGTIASGSAIRLFKGMAAAPSTDQSLSSQTGGNASSRTGSHDKRGKKRRVPKDARMNKPLPSTPKEFKDGVIANLEGAKHVAVQGHSANLSDEVSLEPGEIVRVYQVFDDGWCLIRTAAGAARRKGVCPHYILKLI